MMTPFEHYNDVTDRGRRAAVLFIFPTGWYGMIELSHMGEKNGNTDLVCEKISCLC